MAIINRRLNLLFVHVSRTGGTSATKLLLWQKGSQKFLGKHARATTIKKAMHEKGEDNVWENMTRVAVVRNPYDRAVSAHHYIQERKVSPAHRLLRGKPFIETLKWWRKQPWYEIDLVGMLTDFTCDQEGSLLVNRILRFEKIGQEWKKMCRGLGLRGQLLHINQSQRKQNYRSYYDVESRKLADEMFARDCEMFGYKF